MGRRLIIDGQVFQTPAWDRGMGKYSIELLSALCEQNRNSHYWDEIEIILSSRLEVKGQVADTLQERLPEIAVVRLALEPNDANNVPVANVNRKTIDAYLSKNESEGGIDLLVLSLMQSEIAPAFSSLPYVRNVLLTYDLIPLMFHRVYLGDPQTRKGYTSKLAELLRANLYLTISKTVANDIALHLGISANRIYTIDGGAIRHAEEAKPLEVPRPFILMPTGNDIRKNNRRGVQGFELFNKKNGNKYTLVITSFFQDHEIAELKKLSKNIIFTGNISGEQLDYLYSQTAALLFPAEYEGLGMPILEALEKQRPVACSNISVFREMSKTAFAYFDPLSIQSIADSLERVTQDPKIDRQAYRNVLEHFTWEKTAKRMISALQAASKEANSSADQDDKRQEIAIYSPSPERSLVGKLVQHCHAELSRHCKPSYFMALPQPTEPLSRINYLPHITHVHNLARSAPQDLEKYAAHWFNIADQGDCAAVLMAALSVPGVLLLHDTTLHTLWEAAVQEGIIDKSRLEVERRLDETFGVEGASLLVTLIARHPTVVVHSESAAKLVAQIAKKVDRPTKVIVADLPVADLVFQDVLTPDRDQVMFVVDGPGGELRSTYESIKTIPEKHLINADYTFDSSDGGEKGLLTDMEYLTMLENSRIMAIDAEIAASQLMIHVREAIRMGAAPVVVGDNKPDAMPEEGVQFSSPQQVQDYALQSAGDAQPSRTANRYSYAVYVGKLYEATGLKEGQ